MDTFLTKNGTYSQSLFITTNELCGYEDAVNDALKLELDGVSPDTITMVMQDYGTYYKQLWDPENSKNVDQEKVDSLKIKYYKDFMNRTTTKSGDDFFITFPDGEMLSLPKGIESKIN